MKKTNPLIVVININSDTLTIFRIRTIYYGIKRQQKVLVHHYIKRQRNKRTKVINKINNKYIK